jgi:hypothetical protein
MNGVASDKKPERRLLGRVPTRDSLKHKTAAAAPEKLATWMGGLSVFGVLFCLLLEMIDVSVYIELMSFKISANVGLVGLFAVVVINFVCGAVIYGKALFKPTPRQRRLPQEPVTLPPATWLDAEGQRR